MSTNARLLYIIRVTIIMLLLTGLGSCVRDDKLEFPEEMTETVLRLSTRASVTRADNHYQDDPFAEQNEEAIKRVDLFFFDSDASTTPAFYVCELSVEETTTADLSVGIPVSLIAEKSSVYVYALVNLPESIKVNTVAKQISAEGENAVAATLENIKKTWVSEDAFATSGAVPKTFIMRGGNTVTLNQQGGSEAAAAGVILVERLASKVRLWADIDEIIYIDETTGKTINREDYGSEDEWQAAISKEGVEAWKSIATSNGESEVKLYLYNLTTRGRIEGSASAAGISYFGEDYPDIETDRASLWNYRNVDRSAAAAEAVRPLSADTGLTSPGEGFYPYTHKVAYYSYPNIWDSTTPAEEHQTNVIVSVLWEKMDDNSAEYKTCYYQVPVNVLRSASQDAAQADRLEPNRYYRIKVHIGMLGSTVLDKPTDVKASYEVVDWGIADVNVDIKDRRYLVVNQKNWVMNNVSTLQIPFATSHRTKIECYVNYFRYVDVWGKTDQNISNHNSGEFNAWKTVTDSKGEGYHTTDYGNMYCRPRYFVGPYYVGREHPYTVDPEKKGRNDAVMTEAEKEAWDKYNNYGCQDSVYSCTVDHKNSIINFIHPLIAWDKRTKDGVDYYAPQVKTNGNLWDEYSRCEIIIKIKHEDWDKEDGLFEETIYITQYPGIYVEEDHDYGLENKGKVFNRVTNSDSPYVFVNGNNSPNYSAMFARITYLGNHNGSNNNPNMYVIHITQLSDEDEMIYEIGDPRVLYYNNELISYDEDSNQDPNGFLVDKPENEKPFTSWAGNNANNAWRGTYGKYTIYGPNDSRTPKIYSANRLEDNTNGILKYYYPTDETPEGKPGSKANFIAPILRVAASYGKAADGSKEELRRRCATYQEAGRPAGRWRLPTKAEIKFIAQLSADGKIPILFGSSEIDAATGKYRDGYYWSAQGGVIANGYGKVEDNDLGDISWDGCGVIVNAARCVYDEWYWVKADGSQDVVPEPSNMREPDQPDDEYWGHVTTFMWGDRLKDNPQATPKTQTR